LKTIFHREHPDCRPHTSSRENLFECFATTGAYALVLAKHSKHFVLADAIDIWLGRMQRNFDPMRKQVEAGVRAISAH
jgi:hypothetical protein